jgi:hypothetical protein
MDRFIESCELFRDIDKRITAVHMLTFLYVARDCRDVVAKTCASGSTFRRYQIKAVAGTHERPQAALAVRGGPG